MTKASCLFLTLLMIVFASTAALPQDRDEKPTTLTVHIWDYCDPGTFPDTLCTRANTSSGVITFSGFNFELNLDKSVGAWRFAPEAVRLEEGSALTLKNLGGETHTFTRVRKFGGGFVAALNAASGNPVPAPECARVVNGNLVPQPPGPNNIFLAAGAMANGPHVQGDEPVNYECCIHPWMRMTINPKGTEDNSDGDSRNH